MTLAPEFKASRNLSRKKSKIDEGSKRPKENLELFKHDMLTSLHAIRLGVSQLKGDRNNSELILAIEDELRSLMCVTEENFLDKKSYLAKDLVAYIKKFFLFAYPESQWRDCFEFHIQPLGHKEISVCNLKQILRNLCANFRENGNQKIVIEFSCDDSFHLRIISYSSSREENDRVCGEGTGIRSIRKMLRHSNGFFYFDILEDCVVQELVLPAI